MAEEDNSNSCTERTAEIDELDSLNERLLQLLSSHYNKVLTLMIDKNMHRSLSDTKHETSTNSQSKPSGLPQHDQSKYDCSFLHCDSPKKLPSLSSYLPPIGVFWDIENCRVPKGKSAIAAIQLIRDKFFNRYREAEFIVVCDVQHESTQVIKELNDAQVNLIHVAATCKNAADEKLKQSIRRFADIHGSPAAVVLISNDIHFAADLSDLRYRKKIHVILLHMKESSKALVLCANEHYDFLELMDSLPTRSSQVISYYDLVISNLPRDRNAIFIKRRLKLLSMNYGGRIMNVEPGAAVIRFTCQSFAERAQKYMNGKSVLGLRISVELKKETFTENTQGEIIRSRAASESEIITDHPKEMYSAGASLTGGRTLPMHYQSSSPVIGAYPAWNAHCTPITAPPGLIPPPPVFVGRPYSNNSVSYSRTYNELARVQSPFWQVSGSQQFGHVCEDQYKAEKAKTFNKRVYVPQARDNGVGNNVSARTPDGLRPIRGIHCSSFIQPSDWTGPRQPYHPINAPASYNGNGHAQTNTFKRRSPSPICDIPPRERSQWNNQSQQSTRNPRTPSPYENNSMQMNQQNNHLSPYQLSDAENEEVEKFFNLINNRNGNGGESTPIELQVTNLDQSINPKKMRHMLTSIFLEHVMVLNVSVFTQSDGNFAASIKVPSLADAQYAISQLHRRKVGYKRILISYAHSGRASPQIVRAQIVMLLQEVPGHKLPLFKFREMYESRFMISISVSELYKMKDVCIITEDPSGRMVSLNPDHRNTPSPCFNNSAQEDQLELPYCTLHTVKTWSDKGWAEQKVASLPNVNISLKILDPRIHQLLTTHNGSLPLPSLPYCYEAEFKEKLHVVENGVPLEHLVSCLSCVELKQGMGSVKYLIWTGHKDHENSHDDTKYVSPPLANQLSLFSRELIDLLKTATHCQLPFNRFIPAYHHHFGRQCRVADYGFTKLIDLLEALTHTVQVMGEGNNRVVTLSHRAQVRRFTSDLLRVLKSKASKQVALSEFPSVYARVIAKPWDIVDYGVCDIEDILSEVSENTVVVTNTPNGDKMIAIPKREQTAEEIERTKQFAIEVIELLRHAPQCSMLFNKFVPSYHHHFGHQCRVSNYGFTKLIELFEAIPDIVKIEDDNCGERVICLTEKEGLKVLSEQISKLIAKSKNCLPVANIPQVYLSQFGYALKPEAFGCNSVLQLVQKLQDTVKMVDLPNGPAVVMIDRSQAQQLCLQCRRVLMDQPLYKMPLKEFQQKFTQYYLKPCNIDEVKQNLSNMVQVTTVNDEQFIVLTPLHILACNLYRLLMHYNGTLKVSQLEAAYLAHIGSPCIPAQYSFPTTLALLQALPCTVTIKQSRGKRNIMYLNKKLSSVGIPLPAKLSSTPTQRDTDSSNDSFESDVSSRVNAASNKSLVTEDRGKWVGQSAENHDSWKQTEENNLWSNECDKHWKSLTSEKQSVVNWPLPEHSSEGFLKSIVRTPIMQHGFPPPPPKPDSPPEEDVSKDRWESSVWVTPTKFSYTQDEHTSVQVPPLTLPASWNQLASSESTSNLLSPTKNLLPAAANPLNPRTSPYFSSKHNLVVAPHPSELPLPSLSLTPKKNICAEVIKSAETFVNKLENLDNSIENAGKKGSENEDHKSGNQNETGKHTTPTKISFPGKRRIAAQFNQPIDS